MKHTRKSASPFEFACPLLSDHRTQRAKPTDPITHARSVSRILFPPGGGDISWRRRRGDETHSISTRAAQSNLRTIVDSSLIRPLGIGDYRTLSAFPFHNFPERIPSWVSLVPDNKV